MFIDIMNYGQIRHSFCGHYIMLVIMISLSTLVKGIPLKNESLMSTERRLYKKLMDGYIKEVRPVQNRSVKIDVGFGLSMVNLVDLREKDGILEMNVWYRKTWKDDQLKWEISEWDDIDKIHLPAAKLWLPDIRLYNSAADSNELVFDPEALVYSTGVVVWIPHSRLKSWCALDLTHFPYDIQTCKLQFGSWTYNGEEVNVKFFENRKDVELDDYTEHPEWEVSVQDTSRIVKFYKCCDESYPRIDYTLVLKRKIVYYSHVFMAPAILMILLLPSVFMLPPSSGEKITLGTGIMVTSTLLLVMLDSFLPNGHKQVPVIGMFYLAVLVLAAVSMSMAAIVINISQRKKSSPPSQFFKTIFINFLGKILCVKNDPYVEMDTFGDPSSTALGNGQNEVPVVSGDDREMIMTTRTSSDMVSASDWQLIALVVDRLLLIVFTVVCGIICIAMFAN